MMTTSRNLPRTPAKESGNNHNNSSKGKKKRIFGVFGGGGKKKSPETEASDDTPATAPSTPDALNVTVMDTLYDPSYAYELTTAESNVSGLTDQYEVGMPGTGATPTTASATQARKVGFDMIEEEAPPPSKNENDGAAGERQKRNNTTELSLEEEEGGGTTVASTAIKTEGTGDTVDLSDPTKSCSSPDFLVNQTLGMFDDFCSPPKSTMANPPGEQHEKHRQHQMCGGNLADDYEFDEYSYQPSQLESTVGDSTNDHSYSIQTGITTTNISSDDVNKAGGSEKNIATNTPKKSNTNLPPGFQDHENFEVVLDTALLQGVLPKRRSLFAFSSNKQQREDPGGSEEEKKDDREPPAAGFSSDDDGGYHSSSFGGRKSSIVKRLFSTRKVKDELDDEEEENVACKKKAASARKAPLSKSVPSRAASPPAKAKREIPAPAPRRVPAAPAPAPVVPPPVKKVSPPVKKVGPPVEIDRGSRFQSLEDAKSEPSDEGRFDRTESIERVKSQNLASSSAVQAEKQEEPSPSPSPDDPDMKEKEEKWNSMLAQLKKPSQKTEQDDSAISSLPTESGEETTTISSKSSPRKFRKQMIHSLSHRVRKGLSKKIIQPIKSARKWAKEEISTKNDTNNSKKKSAPTPAPAPAPPVLPAAPVNVPKKPKPIWKAVVDPKTGRTYFYHRKTRETTWIKPEELLAYEADQTPNIKQGKEETKTNSSQNKETPVTNSQEVEKAAAGTTTDEVVVSDDRFNTPPRGKADESEQESTPEESPIVPPAVVKTGNVGMSSLLDRVESEDNAAAAAAAAAAGASTYDPKWEKKKEIERLLTSLSPPDKSSVDNLMKHYEGKEDVLLRQLREKVESQPFDEPFSDEPIGVSRVSSRQTSASAPSKLFTRTTTFISKGSAKTKSSTITDKTEKIKNTWKGDKQAITTISEIENNSAATSISSHQDDNMARSPVRQRELMVEELTGSRIAAETYDPNGKVTRSGASEHSVREDGSDLYFGDNEVDTCTSDSVSALSDHDGDFLSRKENFDQARRRALDDAIEREDWDLAAVLAEGMRTDNSTDSHPKSNCHPSELETLVATNDWDAVKRCISRIQSQKRASLKAIEEDPESLSVGSNTAGESYTTGGFTDPSVVKAPSRPGDLDQDNPLTKRVGSRSQLQHRELVSESSWTSDSSYESSDDSDYS